MDNADARITPETLLLMIRYMVKCCYRYYVLCYPCEADYTYDRMTTSLKKLECGTVPHYLSPSVKIWGDCSDQYPAWARSEPTEQEREAAYDLLSVCEEGL